MKIDKRRFVYSILISLILSVILFIYLDLTTSQNDSLEPEAFLMRDIVEQFKQPYLSISVLISITLIFFIILTFVFYSLIGFFRKKK
jgi:hypothetical protein